MEVKVLFPKGDDNVFGFFRPDMEELRDELERRLVAVTMIDHETDYSDLEEGKALGYFLRGDGGELLRVMGKGTAEKFVVDSVRSGDEIILEGMKKVKRIETRYSRGDYCVYLETENGETLIELWGI